MKKLYGLIVLLIIVAGAFLGYNFVYKISPRDFISQDTIMIYALEEKMSESEKKELDEILKDIGVDYNTDKIEAAQEYISKFYIVSDGNILTGNIDTAAIVDTGLWYPLAIKESSKYFDKDGEFYKLKPEYTKELAELIKELALAQEKNLEIFAAFYKGQIVLSENKIFLKKFIEKEKSYNSKIDEILNANKDNPYGVLVYNNAKHRDIGIEAASITYSMGKDVWEINSKLYGTDEMFSMFQEQLGERKFLKYLNRNQIYLSMTDFSKAEDLIFNPYVLGANKQAITMIWQGMFGISPEEILKDVDGEMIFDSINQSAIIPFKNPQTASKIAKIIEQFGGEVSLKDANTMIYGKNVFNENKNPYSMGAKQFLAADIDFYEFAKLPETQGIKVKVNGTGNEIDIDLFITYDRIKENWNKAKKMKGF